MARSVNLLSKRVALLCVFLVCQSAVVNCGFFDSIGKGIGKAASAVANTTVNVGKAIGSGVKTAAVATAHGVSTAAVATAHGVSTAAVATAHGVSTAAVATVNGVKTAAIATAHGVSTAAIASARFVVKGTTNSIEGAKKIGMWVKNLPSAILEGFKKLKSKDFLSQLFFFSHHMQKQIELKDPTITETNKIPETAKGGSAIPEKVQFVKEQLSSLKDPANRKEFMDGLTDNLRDLQNSPACKQVLIDLIPTLPIIDGLIEIEFLHQKKLTIAEIKSEQ